MAEGKVLWYSPTLGYGFILHKHQEEKRVENVFVGHTDIVGDEALEMGDRVHFQKVRSEEGLEATNVSVIASYGALRRAPKDAKAGLL